MTTLSLRDDVNADSEYTNIIVQEPKPVIEELLKTIYFTLDSPKNTDDKYVFAPHGKLNERVVTGNLVLINSYNTTYYIGRVSSVLTDAINVDIYCRFDGSETVFTEKEGVITYDDSSDSYQELLQVQSDTPIEVRTEIVPDTHICRAMDEEQMLLSLQL